MCNPLPYLHSYLHIQKFQTKFWRSNNSDWGLSMGVYEKFFYYFELFREISNTQLENDIF